MAVSARHAFNVKQSERKQCFVVKVNRFSSRLNQPEASGQQELIKPPAVKLVGSPPEPAPSSCLNFINMSNSNFQRRSCNICLRVIDTLRKHLAD